MIRAKVEKLLKDIIKQDVELERPNNSEFGDYSTNIAFRIKIEPEKIIKKLKDNSLFEKIEKVGGFINFYLSQKALQDELSQILEQDSDYGDLDIGQNKKIQVEFISANPTGPLTVANARGGPFGDVLANVLSKAGYQTERAYYINDAGQQIVALGHSVLKDEQAVYRGAYIDDLAEKIFAQGGPASGGKEKDPNKAGQIAAKYIIRGYINQTTDKLGIKYDDWIFESDLYQSQKVEKSLKFLEKKGLIYKKDGAQWFKSTKFGDKRDRVLVKQDGAKTYLAGDIALHNYKFKDKKFDKVINIWGADHHGDVPGLMAGVEAIGCKGKLEIILLQFVTIFERGEKKKMSKRAGIYVEMDELLDKVGKDAVRFFFLQKSPNTHLNFDIELAKEHSSKNPVYYVQYAHARICSILKKIKNQEPKIVVEKLSHPAELGLSRQLVRFPEVIEDTAKDYQVQRLTNYSLELANSFHKFYEKCRVIDNSVRISLVRATKVILKETLRLMGISAPDKM